MTIDNPWALHPTSPTSNSSFNGVNIAENCPPSGINNALRQLGSFLAQATSYKSADMSASVSTNIAATGTGLYIDILGTGAINSFGTPAGEQAGAAVFRILQFDSSASISHGANIKLVGATSRKTQPGDVSGLIHEGSGVWREWSFAPFDGRLAGTQANLAVGSLSASMGRFSRMEAQSASISDGNFVSLSGSVVNAAQIRVSGTLLSSGTVILLGRASLDAYTSSATDIPTDNSIPQSGEGDEVMSLTVTPRNSSSILRLRFEGMAGGSGAGTVCAAIFNSGSANALGAAACRIEGAGELNTLSVEAFETASTSSRVYTVRFGPGTTNPATAFLNGDGSAGIFGTASKATFTVEEILP